MWEALLKDRKNIPVWALNECDNGKIDLSNEQYLKWLSDGWIHEGRQFTWDNEEHVCTCGHKHTRKVKKYE